MVTKTYEEAVDALVNQLCDSGARGLKQLVEDGALGVGQMTNRELQEAWTEQFSEPLLLTNPDENPNVISYIDPKLHDYVVLALADVHDYLERRHAANPRGSDKWDKYVLHTVRDAVEATHDTFRRILAWQNAGADPQKLEAIARAGGYEAILKDRSAQTRLQNILDRCVRRRLLDVRHAFCEAGWLGAPTQLALNASGPPIYEDLRKEEPGRRLHLSYRVTPNSGAPHKIVAVTFEISDSDNPNAPVVSIRDTFAEPADKAVQEILDRLESPGPGVYEVKLPGFDDGTDKTDHLIKWARADSRADVLEKYPGSAVLLLNFEPPETDIDDTIGSTAETDSESDLDDARFSM